MRFILLKPIIIRDAINDTINRRKSLLLVPTLFAADGECPTWRLWGLTVITKAVRRFRAMRVGCSIWSRGRSVPPLHPTDSGHGVDPGVSA